MCTCMFPEARCQGRERPLSLGAIREGGGCELRWGSPGLGQASHLVLTCCPAETWGERGSVSTPGNWA